MRAVAGRRPRRRPQSPRGLRAPLPDPLRPPEGQDHHRVRRLTARDRACPAPVREHRGDHKSDFFYRNRPEVARSTRDRGVSTRQRPFSGLHGIAKTRLPLEVPLLGRTLVALRVRPVGRFTARDDANSPIKTRFMVKSACSLHTVCPMGPNNNFRKYVGDHQQLLHDLL